jgi:hypothetical protein
MKNEEKRIKRRKIRRGVADCQRNYFKIINKTKTI